jgi:hypothetical protein
MRQKSMPVKEPATQVVKNIRRATRRHFSARPRAGQEYQTRLKPGWGSPLALANKCGFVGSHLAGLRPKSSLAFLKGGGCVLGDTVRKSFDRPGSDMRHRVRSFSLGRHPGTHRGAS